MPAGGAIVAGGLGLAQTALGFINKGKAKREAAKLAASRPKYQESPYAKEAVSLAESELSTGISGAAKAAYEEGIDRDLSGSLNAILKGGGSANNVAEVFASSVQGRQRLALMKDNIRLNQINNLTRAQQFATEEREKAFEFNQWAPWADAAQANAAARKDAEAQIWSGINTAGSAVIRGISGAAGKKELNDYFSSSSPTVDTYTPGLPKVERTKGTYSTSNIQLPTTTNVEAMNFGVFSDLSLLPTIGSFQ